MVKLYIFLYCGTWLYFIKMLESVVPIAGKRAILICKESTEYKKVIKRKEESIKYQQNSIYM